MIARNLSAIFKTGWTTWARRLRSACPHPHPKGDDVQRTAPIEYLVGADRNTDALHVIPLDIARADSALFRTLARRTLGEVRRGDPTALALVEEAYSDFGMSRVLVDENDPFGDCVPFDELPDSHPFDDAEWFGEDPPHPQARLRTAKYAPWEIMEEFGRDDYGVGFVGYEPADWLDCSDSEAIEARLRELGYRVVHDSRLLAQYYP